MRLKNKKTGEMGDLIIDKALLVVRTGTAWLHYSSLAELNEEWCDYEEPKEPKEPKDTNYWCIDSLGKIEFHSTVLDEIDGTPNNAMTRKIIGNYFDTREEAKQAVEKLKALKRLKDKGFRFEGHSMLNYAPNDNYDYSPSIGFSIPELDKDEPYEYPEEVEKDLDICFGGEE